jgi:hypothetical protein
MTLGALRMTLRSIGFVTLSLSKGAMNLDCTVIHDAVIDRLCHPEPVEGCHEPGLHRRP